MASLTAQAYDTLALGKPKLALVFLLSILVFFSYHTKDFKLDASADTLLLEDDADLKVFRKIYERYPSSDLLIVTYTPEKDLFSDQALEPLRQLRGELEKVAGVDTVFTILDAPLFDSSDQDVQNMLEDMPSLEKSGIDQAKARDELVNSPIYRDLIITISMNIHLIVRYRQLHRDHPGDDQLALVRATTHKMVKPCLYTALTTIIGVCRQRLWDALR